MSETRVGSRSRALTSTLGFGDGPNGPKLRSSRALHHLVFGSDTVLHYRLTLRRHLGCSPVLVPVGGKSATIGSRPQIPSWISRPGYCVRINSFRVLWALWAYNKRQRAPPNNLYLVDILSFFRPKFCLHLRRERCHGYIL